MSDFVLVTEVSTDLPLEYYSKHGIDFLSFELEKDGAPYSIKGDEQSLKEFYSHLRNRSAVKTALINIETYSKKFEQHLKEGKDVLSVTLSSALSGSNNCARLAAAELSEKYPDRKIYVLDSLGASLGQGLLVDYLVKMKAAGKSIDEVYNWGEDNKLHISHLFTVDDLFFLKRGGRVSGATALVGTMLSIKPVLHVSDGGTLESLSKARGRKAALTALVDTMAETGIELKNQTVFISHGDCIEDAEFLSEKIKERFGVKDIMINYIGATIGSHSGPGTVAVFFYATKR